MKTSLQTLIFVIFSCSLFGQSTYDNLFLKALADEKFEDASYWLEKGANINIIDKDGLSPLFYAVAYDNYNLVTWLIDKGANVNIQDNRGFTNLMGATKNGNLRMCYLLYSKGANLKLKTFDGKNAQEYAENEGYIRVAEFLKNPNSYSEDLTCWECILQSNLLSENGEQNQAIVLAEQAKKKALIELRAHHPLYALILNNLALLYNKSSDYERAEQLYIEALEIAKVAFGDKDFYATILYNLAEVYINTGYYTKAEPHLLQTMNIRKELLGDKNSDYIACIENLAVTYKGLGSYEKAEFYSLEASRLYKETLGDKHPLYALSLSNLAAIYQVKGKYKQAEPLIINAIRINKASFGENNLNYATALNNLAQLYIDMGQYERADSLLKVTLQIYKSVMGKNHTSYALALNNLSVLYSKMGLYEQAEPLINESMQIVKVSMGENHPDYCMRINNLAQLYQMMGRYEEAEPLMEDAIRITKESFRENHPDYSVYINNLALLYKIMARYELAEPLMIEARRIDEKSLGVNHPSYSRDLNNLAMLYEVMGRYEEAESLLEEATRITKESLGEDHADYAKNIMNLAGIYQDMGKYDQAEPLMKDALRIQKSSLGVTHPDYSRILNNMAQLYQAMGHYEQAVHLMKEAMRIDISSLGKNHPDYGRDLHNLAGLFQTIGKYEQAEPLIKEAYSIIINNFQNNCNYLSETELYQFYEKVVYTSNMYQSFNYQYALSGKIKGDFAMEIELFQKGLLLNSVIETRKSILNSGDTSLISSYQTMKTYRKQADKLYSIPKEQRYEEPAILEEKANELEKDIKLQSKEYSRSLEEAEITWRQIQEKMKPDEAIVEFASFGYYNKQWTDSTLYCALVLRKQDTIPQMVYLFEEKQLAEALPKSGNSSDATINNTYAILRGNQLVQDSSWYQGDNLYNLVWKPLDSLLSGIKTVNYDCSGLLNTVSFAAVPDATGKLLCEKYALNQYSSTRNLVIETKELPITDASIYGGIRYELDTSLMIANSRQYSKTNDFTLAYNSTRSGNKRGNGFDDLEGTREEANSINALFKEKKITTNNYTRAVANEESFKAMAEKKSPSVIHLSTHGFYYPETTTPRKSAPELQIFGSDLNRFQYSPDPLLRSGIVLAGANRVWRGEPVPDGVEDGILTAKDVSQLNLSNTQLVVLSACQTGLGDVKGSEGVFGLQRAFKMAGVRYLMMSLWSVPDKETKEFMEKFYNHWLSGIPIRNAFQTAQQEMRVKYPMEPYKWAAFVLVE